MRTKMIQIHLNTGHSTENQDSTVQNTKRTLYLDSKIDVTCGTEFA